MKLFRVEVHQVVYVLAEDEHAAELEGQTFANEVDPDYVGAQEVRTLADVDADWKDSIPYGGKEDETCRQYFEKPLEPKPYVDPPEQQWFGFAGDGSPNPA